MHSDSPRGPGSADDLVTLVSGVGHVERSQGLDSGQMTRFRAVLDLVDLSDVKRQEKDLYEKLASDEFPEVGLRSLERSAYVFNKEVERRGGKKKVTKDEKKVIWRICLAAFHVQGDLSQPALTAILETLDTKGLSEPEQVADGFRLYGPHCMYRSPAALAKATCAAVHCWSWRTIPEHEDMSAMWGRLDNEARTHILRRGLSRLVDIYAEVPCCIATEDLRRTMATKFVSDLMPTDTIMSTSVIGRLMRTFSVRVLDNVTLIDRISLYEKEKAAPAACVITDFNHETWGGARTFAEYAVNHCQDVLRLCSFVAFEEALFNSWKSASSVRDDIQAVMDPSPSSSSTRAPSKSRPSSSLKEKEKQRDKEKRGEGDKDKSKKRGDKGGSGGKGGASTLPGQAARRGSSSSASASASKVSPRGRGRDRSGSTGSVNESAERATRSASASASGSASGSGNGSDNGSGASSGGKRSESGSRQSASQS